MELFTVIIRDRKGEAMVSLSRDTEHSPAPLSPPPAELAFMVVRGCGEWQNDEETDSTDIFFRSCCSWASGGSAGKKSACHRGRGSWVRILQPAVEGEHQLLEVTLQLLNMYC